MAIMAMATAHVRGSGWARAFCPFCDVIRGTPDRERALSIHTEHGGFHCHRCGTSGRLAGHEAEQTLEDLRKVRPNGDDAQKPPPGFVFLQEEAGRESMALDPARDYLTLRGVSEEVQAEIHVGAVASGDYANRVVIPVMADDATWMGWCARLWAAKCDKKKKYRFPNAMPRGEVLFNHRALYVRTDEPVYVVEGAFDVLPHWPHAVAVFGDVTQIQLETLALAHRPVVFVPDGDAWIKGEMLAYQLRLEGQMAGWVRLPPKKDPDEVPTDWLWEEARKNLRRL